MRVVATTGMPGSGKSLAVEVANELDIEVIRMGDLIREETAERELPKEPASFGRVASEVRQAEGADAWAHRTVDRLRETDADMVLIDGVRNLEELGVFRNELGEDLLLVAILASPDTRYERLAKRGRAEDSEDREVLLDRDLRELDYGLGDVIAMADIYIENEGSPDEARSTLRAVLGAGG